MVYYVSIAELLKENGPEDCILYKNRNDVEKPYITIKKDYSANCGRGEVSIKFKDRLLYSRYMYPARGQSPSIIEQEFISEGDLCDAKKTLLKFWK